MKKKRKKTVPTRYVIFQRERDDYLGLIEETDELIRYGWTPHPGDALKYETFERAEAVAHNMVENKPHGYQLEICELNETENQLFVRPVAIVVPHASLHNPDLN